jgi:membrane fusion protein, adhesin transport system
VSSPVRSPAVTHAPVSEDFDESALFGDDVAVVARLSSRVVWTSVAAVAALIVYAGFATVDEVARGEGKVIPSRQVQVVQSLDGGMVAEIHVRVGQVVNAGDPLLTVDPTRVMSSLRESRAEYLALKAKAARLSAIANGRDFVPPADVQKEAPQLVAQERAHYDSQRAELTASVAIAEQQRDQRSQELHEARSRREQAQRALDLTQEEFDRTKPLLRTGAVSEMDLLRLERDISRLRGERDQAGAQVTRMRAAISEAERKMQEVALQYRNQARSDLTAANSRLGQLTEGSVGLADRVKQTVVRSPVRGTVKQLLANTVGGVVQPGKDIVEIVPLDDALLIEAKVVPRDIAFLRPGQPATVRFTAYDFSIYGGMDGALEEIGADTIADERGNAFYVVRVRTRTAALGQRALPIIPGMVAEVDILTGKKTILSYLLKPVLRARAAALTER